MTGETSHESDGNSVPDQLRAADIGGGGGAEISRSAEWVGGAYAIAIGLLIAAFLLVVVYVYPTRIPWLIISVTITFFAGITIAIIWYQRQRRASSRGWTKRYSVGFALTIMFYAVGNALAGSIDLREIWFWLPYAVLTALPVVIGGMPRRAR